MRTLFVVSLFLLLPHNVTAKTIMHLVDELRAEHVTESPLLHVPAIASLDALEKVKSVIIFDENFENFSYAKAGWAKNTATVGVAKRSDNKGKALRFTGGQTYRHVFVLPALGATYYRVRRAIETADPKVDLRILETRVALKHPRTLNHPEDVKRVLNKKFVAMSDLLRLHRFLTPKSNHWQRDSMSFFSNTATRSLVLMVDHAESVISKERLNTWLDDLQVAQLQPTSIQRMGLAKGAHTLVGSDVKLGIAKHGQLLPTGEAEKISTQEETNYDYRYALLAATPTTMTFAVNVPAAITKPRFSFSCALAKWSQPGRGAVFSVRIRNNKGVQQVFQKTITLAKNPRGIGAWRWHEAAVSLDDFAGQEIQLILSTEPQGSKGALALWGSPLIDTARAKEEAPNVLVIGVDTLRADRLGAYGYHRRTSPHIDALARDGWLFERAQSASNWTTSAFASIFTGMLPADHRVIHRARSIAPGVTTLAEYFHRAGWLTQGFAYKAYLYEMGFEQGFDGWFNVPRSKVTADENLSHALNWLKRHGDRRFFMFFHLNDPHQPFNQPAPFDRMFNKKSDLESFGIKLPLTIGTTNRVLGCKRCRKNNRLDPSFKKLGSALYDGAVAFTDDTIGKLIDALKQRGIYDNTIIALVSDHGEVIWDRANYFGHGGTHMSDELIRVPLIIKPASSQAQNRGKIIPQQVRSYDLMPTLLRMTGLGLDVPWGTTPLVAKDLLQVVDAATPRPRVAIAENIKQRVLAVSLWPWKYILSRRSQQPVEYLYNLQRDAKERRNVAGMHTSKMQQLRKIAIDHIKRTATRSETLTLAGKTVSIEPQKKSQAHVERQGVDADQLAVLRALGYVE